MALKTSKHKVLKMIGTKEFIIELVESESGSYRVITESKQTKEFSVPMRDLTTAMAVFDAIYQSFQEN